MNDEIEIFKGKTFQSLIKDIYENSKSKKSQLDLLVQEIHTLINGVEDVALLGPVIKELMDVSVKNDEHLVKLASVLQRIITKSQTGTDEDSLGLSDHEKEELIETLQSTANDLQKENDRINEIENIKSKFQEN